MVANALLNAVRFGILNFEFTRKFTKTIETCHTSEATDEYQKKNIRDMNKLRFRLCWIEFCSMPVFGCRFIIYPLVQSGLAGRWIKFPKGREHAQGVCSNFGQPKAEFNPTYEYTHCVYPPLLIAYIHYDLLSKNQLKQWLPANTDQ